MSESIQERLRAFVRKHWVVKGSCVPSMIAIILIVVLLIGAVVFRGVKYEFNVQGWKYEVDALKQRDKAHDEETELLSVNQHNLWDGLERVKERQNEVISENNRQNARVYELRRELDKLYREIDRLERKKEPLPECNYKLPEPQPSISPKNLNEWKPNMNTDEAKEQKPVHPSVSPHE